MKLLSTKQLAERWGLSEGTLRNWRMMNKGPRFIRIGRGKRGQVRYKIEAIVKWESRKAQ